MEVPKIWGSDQQFLESQQFRGGVEWVVKGETKAMRIVCMERGVKGEQESGEQGVSLLAAWGSPSTHSLLP